MARASRKDGENKARKPRKKAERGKATGACLCGAVEVEVATPVFWAWHDHSVASRRAHGAVYATYVGTYRSKTRIAKGEADVRRFVEPASGNVRSFCGTCGSPVMYERKQSPKWVNVPRALFAERTGREPRTTLPSISCRTGSTQGRRSRR